MVSSPYYERLQAVAELSHFDSFEMTDFAIARMNLDRARYLVSEVQANPGISGEVKNKIGERLQQDIETFNLHEKNIRELNKNHAAAREVMLEAKKSWENLSPSLLSPLEEGLRFAMQTVSWMGIALPVEHYLNEIETQKNTERELAAQNVLKKMNSTLLARANDKLTSTSEPRSEDPSSHSNSSSNFQSSSTLRQGGSSGNMPITPAVTTGLGAVAPVANQVGKLASGSGGLFRPSSSASEAQRGTAQDLADTTPQWPRDALKYPIGGQVTSDGPVGGYMPAPVTDINDPRWRSDFSHPGLGMTTPTKASGIVAGLVGTSAGALAARSAGGATPSGMSGMGSVMVPPGMSGATGAAGRGGVGGSTKSATRASSTAATARNSAMRLGAGEAGMAGTHGTHGRGSKDEKKSRNIIGYQVVHIDDETTSPIDSSSFGAGDALSLKPLRSEEQDKW